MGDFHVVRWSDLPEDVIEQVLSKLPLPSILKLRTTCRTWNTLVVSRDLLSRSVGDSSPVPCLLGTSTDCEKFAGYNPVSKSWFELGLAFPVPDLRQSVYLAASAGGLLCFAATIEESAAFFVCNPTTRSWRQLPPTALKIIPRVSFGHHVDLATCMVFDKTRQQYKIIVVGNAATGSLRSWHRITQVYYSCTKSWRKLGGTSPQDVDFRSYGLVCHGCVYYMMAGWSLKVMLVNIEEGIWSKLDAPLPRFLVRPRLVERNGSLLLVGGVHKYWRQGWNFLKPQSVRIWELDQTNVVWVEVGRMPENIHCKFVATLGDGIQDFKCAGFGQYLYFSSRCSTGLSVVLFNFSNSEWSWIRFPDIFTGVEDIIIFQAKLSSAV